MLSVQHVTKSYARKTALNKVSLDVPPGKIFGLLGPNGAGKTSLIRIITMITAPDEGKITFDGEPVTRDFISRIGYLPEERGLYRKMKVWDQAIYFARLKGLSTSEAKSRISAWMKRLDMWSWRTKKVEELSKGMQQKVQFMLTVLHEPQLIILDEPFTGFDPVNSEIITNEILDLKAKGATIILSTHRMESVEELCDEITLINNAQVVLSGNTSEVRERYYKNEYSLLYEAEQALDSVQGADILEHAVLANNRHRILLQLHKETEAGEVFQRLSNQVRIKAFSEELPSIKQIFIQLVGGAA